MDFFKNISGPDDLKNMSIPRLEELADFLRKTIIGTISKTGGHLASSLGTVELTVALHRVFNSPKDKIIWDVGHQCYAHKLLTGRIEEFSTIRSLGGLSGFTKPGESCHDPFGAGHSSTSISAALGFAAARDLSGEKYDVVAVIGDGALTGGLAYEGMNNAGHLDRDLIIILNDNEMSISKNVGALARHLSHLRMAPPFVKVRRNTRRFVRSIPVVGMKLLRFFEAIEDHVTYLLTVRPGVLFEALGLTYLGPFDGHNINNLVRNLERIKDMKGPRIVHVLTQKGKGYEPAERDSTTWHGAMPFDVETGNGTSSGDKKVPAYSEVFCRTLIKLAEKDEKIVAVTAAMPDGTGLVPFREKFPKRIFDVGIAEPHAVTFSAGMAAAGMKPLVAIYSTFLQRAYDQIIHDVALQKLPVVFIIDRGGLVGEDGPTHHGVFDLSFLRSIPDITVMAPKDENELQHMIYSAFCYGGPVAIRYPRGKGVGVRMDPPEQWAPLEPGKAEIMCRGNDLAILAVGSMVYPALLSAEMLHNYGISATVVNMRFVKPLDTKLIGELARETGHLITVEENSMQGGLGAGVMEAVHEMGINNCMIETVGVPDKFIEHGNMNLLREKLGLTSEGIVLRIRDALQTARIG